MTEKSKLDRCYEPAARGRLVEPLTSALEPLTSASLHLGRIRVASKACRVNCGFDNLNLQSKSSDLGLVGFVVQTLLSWSCVVFAYWTHVSCVFLRFCHVFTCHVYFNVALSMQHSRSEPKIQTKPNYSSLFCSLRR